MSGAKPLSNCLDEKNKPREQILMNTESKYQFTSIFNLIQKHFIAIQNIHTTVYQGKNMTMRDSAA